MSRRAASGAPARSSCTTASGRGSTLTSPTTPDKCSVCSPASPRISRSSPAAQRAGSRSAGTCTGCCPGRCMQGRSPARDGSVVRNPVEVRQPTAETGRTRLVGYRDLDTGEVITDRPPVHWIERTNRRLIHALGVLTREGERVHLADRQCAERARVLRLAGSVNGKTGRYARIARLDLWLPAYSPELLVGDLGDPPAARPRRRSASPSAVRRVQADPARGVLQAPRGDRPAGARQHQLPGTRTRGPRRFVQRRALWLALSWLRRGLVRQWI